MSTPSSLAVGTRFESFKDAAAQIVEHSYIWRGNLHAKQTDTQYRHFLCTVDDCPFEAKVAFDKREQEYILKVWNPEHTCAGLGKTARGTINALQYIEPKVRSPCLPG